MDEMRRRDFLVRGTGLVAGLTQAGGTGAAAKATAATQSPVAEQTGRLRLELMNNALRFRGDWCEIPDWSMGLEVENELLQTTAARAKLLSEEPLQVEFHFPARQLTWGIRAETEPASNRVILRSTIRNDSQQPVALGKAILLQSDKVSGFSRPGDDLVYLPMSSGQGLNQVRALNAKPAASDIAIQAFNQNQKRALQVGFVTFLRAKTQVEHEYSPAKGLQLKAWCEFDGWELQPGSQYAYGNVDPGRRGEPPCATGGVG